MRASYDSGDAVYNAGESLLILFVPQRRTTFFNDRRNGISLARQRTFSPQSPLMPRLVNLLPKILFQPLVYRVRPATIQSPIMMELKFSCLTWKQWFWWILSQLLLENLSDRIEVIIEAWWNVPIIINIKTNNEIETLL